MAFQRKQADLNQLDKIVRNEFGKMISTFTRLFGIQHLHLAEKVIEESTIKARSIFQSRGMPQNTKDLIWNIARIKGTEILRRENRLYDKSLKMNQISSEDFKLLTNLSDELIRENQLRMMFVSCHPTIERDSQVTLILKLLGGFNIQDIAKGLSINESATVKRLKKGREKMRELKIAYDLPKGSKLSKNLNSVLQSLYLIFNKGYNTPHENVEIGSDFCIEAIRLATLLVEDPLTDKPETNALLSLMLLEASRLPAKFDENGDVLLLQEQDRSLWNRNMINKGLSFLHKSASSNQVSEYHLRAGVSACHGISKNYRDTDWRKILSLYDNYLMFNSKPDIELDRAIAYSKVFGARPGIKTIKGIAKKKELAKNHLLYSTLGNLYLELNQYKDALHNYKKALKYSELKNDQSFYKKKIDICSNRIEMTNRYGLQKSF